MRSGAIFAALLTASVLVILCAMMIGPHSMNLTEIKAALLHPKDEINGVILWSLRLPRSLVAFAAGAGLAVSGHLMQVLMRNPLASPSLTGATSGAVMVIVTLFIHAPYISPMSYPFFGAGGALAAAGLTLAASHGGRASPFHLALAGFSVSLFLSGLTTYILLRAGPASPSVMFWLAGGFQGRSWGHLAAMLPWVAFAVIGALASARVVGLLSMGESVAGAMGVSVSRWKLALLVLAVLPVAGIAPTAGAVGFIGIAVPHLVRLMRPENPFWTIALNVAAGGLLCVTADALARTIAAPREIPVSVLTALLGGPAILWLIRRWRVEETA